MKRPWLVHVRLSAAAVLATTAALPACGSSGSSGTPDTGLGSDSGVHVTSGEGGTSVVSVDGSVTDGGTSRPDVVAIQPGKDAETEASQAAFDAGRYDALPALPQVANADGGVLANPEIIAVFFQNDDATLLPQLEDFYNGIGGTPFWSALTEYGIGAPTVQIKVLSQDAPATIDDTYTSGNTALETWLLGEISNKDLPAPGANTEYVLNYPATTKVTSDGDQCVDFDGYHSDLTDSSNDLIAYAVVPRCTDPMSTTIATFASSASHELIEGATDPFPDYQPGWSQSDIAHLFWDEANDGSEIGDMCENDPEAYYEFPGFDFTIQRFWSNKSALAGHDPCVPEIPGKTFFNAVPELPNTGLFNYYGTNVDVSSIHIPVGQSATIYLDLYSDGSIPDWDVIAFDYYYGFVTGDASTALLTFDMPHTTGNNGDRLPVTITVKTAGNETANQQVANTELFVIESSQGTSETAPAHYWYGLVTN